MSRYFINFSSIIIVAVSYFQLLYLLVLSIYFHEAKAYFVVSQYRLCLFLELRNTYSSVCKNLEIEFRRSVFATLLFSDPLISTVNRTHSIRPIIIKRPRIMHAHYCWRSCEPKIIENY